MRGKLDRDTVDWERASCRGLETDWFYTARSDLLEHEGINLNVLRRICFECPIWRECLKVGTADEAFGFWGGLNEFERRDIHMEKKGTRVLMWLERDMKTMPVELKEVVEIVRSVDRDYTWYL